MFLSRSGLDLSKIAQLQGLNLEAGGEPRRDAALQAAKRQYHSEPNDETRDHYANRLRRSGDHSEANRLQITEPYQKLAQARTEAHRRFIAHHRSMPYGYWHGSGRARDTEWDNKYSKLSDDLVAEGGVHHKMRKFLKNASEQHGPDFGRHLRPHDGQRDVDHIHDLVAASHSDSYGHQGVQSSGSIHRPPQDVFRDNDNEGEGAVKFGPEHGAHSRQFVKYMNHHYPKGSTHHETDSATPDEPPRPKMKNYVFYTYKPQPDIAPEFLESEDRDSH